jgi:hypothetical protein
VLIVAAVIFALPTARADIYCSGTVLEHLVTADGTLMIRSSWRGDWTTVCGMQTSWNGVTTEACFSWFALTTAAKVHAKQVGVYYRVDVPCNAIGTYGSAPVPFYVRMQE